MDLVDTDEEMENENVSYRPIQSGRQDSPYLSPIPFTSSHEVNLGYLSYSKYGPHDRETTLLNLRADTDFYKKARLPIKSSNNLRENTVLEYKPAQNADRFNNANKA